MKRELILEDYKNKLEEIDRFRNDLLQSLGKDLFRYDSIEDILYNSLKSIYPTNRYLKRSEKSIEKKAGEVLAYFKIRTPLKVIVKDLSDNKVSDNSEELKKSYIQRYSEQILRLKQPPKVEYQRLLTESQNHLSRIIDRINFYSNLPYIKRYKRKNDAPSSNQERTILNFYFRCIDEEQQILDFIYKGGIEERAIHKSSRFLLNIPEIYFIGFNDFPYRSSSIWFKGYFNHEQIQTAHRVRQFYMDESEEMKSLYYSNKKKFYRLYFNRNSKDKVINEIIFHCNSLPLSDNRKLIINELIHLFKKKRWISFYGLALSQIEGLFSEMLELIPRKSNPRSLPLKVNLLRSFYDLSESYFDYFEYYIPELRNKFMHGIIDGREQQDINSFDFLIDIHFLLDTINNLNSPLIILLKKLKNHELEISKLDEVGLLFDLFNNINQKHKSETKILLSDFFNEYLISNANLEYMLYSVIETLANDIKEVEDHFERKYTPKINLSSLNNKRLKGELMKENKEELVFKIFESHSELIQKLRCQYIFLSNYKRFSKKIPKDLNNLINDYINPFKVRLSKISLIADIFLNRNRVKN